MRPKTRQPSRHPLARTPAVLLAVALATAGCSDKVAPLGTGTLADRVADNWDLWQSWTAPDYEFEFQWSCYCLDELTEPVLVRVVGHAVSEVTYLADGVAIDPDHLVLFPTIAQLFLHIEEAIDADADVILVEFHEEHGYPISAVLDYEAQIADDELSFTVGELSGGP